MLLISIFLGVERSSMAGGVELLRGWGAELGSGAPSSAAARRATARARRWPPRPSRWHRGGGDGRQPGIGEAGRSGAAGRREPARLGERLRGGPGGPGSTPSGCFGVCSTPGGERKTRGALGEGRVVRGRLAPEKLDPPLPWPTAAPCLSFPVGQGCAGPLHPGQQGGCMGGFAPRGGGRAGADAVDGTGGCAEEAGREWVPPTPHPGRGPKGAAVRRQRAPTGAPIASATHHPPSCRARSHGGWQTRA